MRKSLCSLIRLPGLTFSLRIGRTQRGRKKEAVRKQPSSDGSHLI
jgi:hypothetical protein